MGQNKERAASKSMAVERDADGAQRAAFGLPAHRAGVAGGPDIVRPAKGPARVVAKKAADPQLMGSFFDEAIEIMGTLDRSIGNLSREPADPLHIRHLLENLHTLKGGARLCGLTELGELVHGFETFLTTSLDSGIRLDGVAFEKLRTRRDRLSQALDGARAAGPTPAPPNKPLLLADGVPFSRLLPRLTLVVRQLGEQLRKRVEIHPSDVDVELNGGILKRLTTPLEHLLRNAVDHGIETPERRRQRGKPETGRIDLRTEIQNGEIVIEVVDDGGGIDFEKVQKLAAGNRALAANPGFGERETAELIFAPGLSTAEFVTGTSGRGIGLSAAMVAVGRLGGRIGVSFRPGRGTSFHLRIPRAASVEQSSILTLRDDLYAIPNRGIDDIVTVAPDTLDKPRATGMFEYGGASCELRYLGEFMGLHDNGAWTGSRAVVILEQPGARRIAVHADTFQEHRDILVRRARGDELRTDAIHLATRLDDGGIVVMLDPRALAGFDGSGPTR